MRRGKFCPKCGKDAESLYDGFCSDCFLGKMKLSDKIPPKIVLGNCKMCGRVFLGERRFEMAENAVEFFLDGILKQKEIKKATYRIAGNSLWMTIDMEVSGLAKTLEKNIPMVNKSITCKFCNLKKGNYYNVTIQVRVPKAVEDKIVGEIEAEMGKLNRFDNYAFISGVQKLKEGTDLFVGSKNAADRIVRYMQRKYKAKTKTSRKLYGLIEGKKSYRDTVLVSIGD